MYPSSELIWQDTQHTILFKLLDELAREVYDPTIINQLKLYADHHFCLEEAYMHKLSYPDKDAHVRAHNRFREELYKLEQDHLINGMNAELRLAVSRFLTEWLTRHIMGVDKDFETFVLDSNIK